MLPSTSGASPQQLSQSPQTNNQNNNGLIGGGSNNIINSFNTAAAEGEDVELDRLLDRYISKDALRDSFYSPPECYPNTRTTVRNEIDGWLDETVSKKSPLLWLNGPAAVGKSVIAKTISGFRHQFIVASFFFSTSSDKSAATLFPTLAWQLARRIPDTRQYIIASLKNSGSLQTSQIEEQFDRLIIQPLKSITALGFRPVMVIDGVDECTDENMLVRFLRVLVQAGKSGDMPVRFLICSRPELRIEAILGVVHDINLTTHEKKLLPHGLVYIILKEAGGLAMMVFFLFLSVAAAGLLGSFRLFPRKDGIFHLFRLIRKHGEQWINTITFASPFALLLVLVYLVYSRPRTRGLLQDVRELYRITQLGVDKDGPASDRLDDIFDKICPHSVVSTIQIGFSQECKDDIARYLTDKFNTIRSGNDTGPWFQPSDISDLVTASCGQFLYASIIVKLLDDPHFDPRDVLEMARHSSLPTPNLNELYKTILKREQDTIRKQARAGGSDYKTEWGFVMDSLAILVCFEGNVPFITVGKSFSVIEILLGLEKGKLDKKLCKMHSVLRIVPGESVRIYHRSFFEFLSNRQRSEEYHVGYLNALPRTMILVIRARLRYDIKHFHWLFK